MVTDVMESDSVGLVELVYEAELLSDTLGLFVRDILLDCVGSFVTEVNDSDSDGD